MGEYAEYKGQQIKIGTCENMYYLRADQAKAVKPLSGNVDPVADRESIRFRFPWPDEDGVEPGHFEYYGRKVVLYGVPVPEGVEHGRVQFHADPGYLVSLPCPESTEAKGLNIMRNGFPGALAFSQQKHFEGKLVLIGQCNGCGHSFRFETLADVQPVLDALELDATRYERDGRIDESRNTREIAARILAGYTL